MQVGRSIVGPIALFLVVLMASPVYDIYSLHQQKHRSADNLMSQERRWVYPTPWLVARGENATAGLSINSNVRGALQHICRMGACNKLHSV